MEKWSVLSERCGGREAWISTTKKHVQTGTKSYQGTHIQTIWVLSEGWIQEHKTQSPHISYCLGKKKKGKRGRKTFLLTSDFLSERGLRWPGAEQSKGNSCRGQVLVHATSAGETIGCQQCHVPAEDSWAEAAHPAWERMENSPLLC